MLRVAKATAEAERVELWAVGGAVRNALLGVPVLEVDMATTAKPDQVITAA
ncbi:MAG TPA: CCA tRNA nucleotidyltransferase, partial [Dehalococcoidia bacterium]|nr:CCA tRNA nucleotidyltransferase [Dehalococcoidia bacterium]